MGKPVFYFPVLLFLGASLLAVYWSSFRNGFVNIDDAYFILENKNVHQLTIKSVKNIFTTFGRDFHYVPLFYLYATVVYDAFGPDAFYFHLISFLIHAVNSLLVFYLFEKLTGKKFLSFFTALIFAVHPLQVEAVCWASGMKTLLFSFFYLLSITAYYFHRCRANAGRVKAVNIFSAGSHIFFILSMLTKTTAVTLPVMLLAIDYFLAGSGDRKFVPFLKKYLPGKMQFLPAIAMLYYINSLAASKAFVQLQLPYTPFDHFIIIGHNIFFYLQKALIPLKLSLYYNPPAKDGAFLPAYYYLFAALGYALTALAAVSAFRHRFVFLGASFFFIPLAIMIDTALFMSDIIILTADRYFYLPAAGMFFLLGLGTERVMEQIPKFRPIFFWGASAFLALGFGYLSNRQTRVWENSIALYENTLANEPNSEFFLRLGWEYFKVSNHQKAYENFQKGFNTLDSNTVLRAKYAIRHTTPGEIGLTYGKEGMHDWARRYFELAVKMHPQEGIWWANLGRASQMLGDTAAADSCFRRARQLGFSPEKIRE